MVRGHAFGAYVRKHREAKGVSLRKFAYEAGMSPTYLSKIERSEFPPPGEPKIVHIAALLGLDPDELLARAGRIASDLPRIIMQHPHEMAALVRQAARLSVEQLGTLQSVTEKLKGTNKVQGGPRKVRRRRAKVPPTSEDTNDSVNARVEQLDFERPISFED